MVVKTSWEIRMEIFSTFSALAEKDVWGRSCRFLAYC